MFFARRSNKNSNTQANKQRRNYPLSSGEAFDLAVGYTKIYDDDIVTDQNIAEATLSAANYARLDALDRNFNANTKATRKQTKALLKESSSDAVLSN